MGAYVYRLLGACVLDRGTYEGIEGDRRSAVLFEAMATVVLSSLAAGVGALGLSTGRGKTFVFMAFRCRVTWLAWAVLIQQIGTRIMPEPETRSDVGELLRTVGFAAAPGLFQVFAIFPGITSMVFVVTWSWMLAAMVVAVRQA